MSESKSKTIGAGRMLALALVSGWLVLGPGTGTRAQEGTGGDETTPGKVRTVRPGDAPGDKGTEAAERDKTDPADIRNVLDNLNLVRDLKKKARPEKSGIWKELLDKPYFKEIPLLRAEKLLFYGQYPEAETLYISLLKGGTLTADEKAQAEENRLEAVFRQGSKRDLKRFNDGVAALSEAARATPHMVSLQAEALLQAGNVPEAAKLLRAFVERTPKLTPMRPPVLHAFNQYGDILESQANYPGAITVYERVAALATESVPEDPAIQTELAIALERDAVLTGKAREKQPEIKRRLEQVIKLDRTYWPAHLALARLFLGAHNVKDGGGEVQETLSLNPYNVDAMFLGLYWSIDNYDFDGATAELDELKESLSSAEVDVAEGALWLKQRQPDKAIAPLLRAVKENPSSPEARGLLAGAYYLCSSAAKAEEQLAAVTAPDGAPHPVVLFQTAEILRDARQYTQAEKLYQKSAKAAAWWSEPFAALAQLYMETGQEDNAKIALDESFKIDPYNLRAFNQLTLLDMLRNKFQTKTTPHFIIRYNVEDQVLADLVADWMEKVYPEVLGYFQVKELPVQTTIEMFPSHEEFGVRTTGLPWIGTVGASTGNVIAMDVPRGGSKDQMGAFDWARVLRHEFTHTVTLAMTNNRIPHWLTEACAVDQEESPRDWENCQLLCSNYRAGTLFKMQDLNWGFIRPKRSIDRQLAYMESQWIYEYLKDTYGHQKVLDFLNCFRDGMTEYQAYKVAFGKSMEEMNTDFMAWAGKQIESWGLPSDPLPNLEQAQAAVKTDPKDVDAACKLAWVLMSSGKSEDAETTLRKALEIDPKNLRARELLGAVLNVEKKTAEARKTLEDLLKDDPKRPVALRTLGLLAMQEKEFGAARSYFEQLEKVRPLEETPYMFLAGLYLKDGQVKDAIAQLRMLQAHEQKDERIPRQLALLLRQDKQYQDAETMAYKAIRINPYNAVNHQLMALVLMDERKPGEAVRYWRIAAELQPKVASFWAGLADALGAVGDAPGASDAAKKAVDLQPNSPAAKWVLP